MNAKLLLPVALIMMLLFVGVAYSHWEKIVTVSGTVETGTLELTPSIEELWSDDAKEYATIEGYIEGNTIVITISTVYPCITVGGTLNIENTGSIPAGFHDIDITLPSGMSYVQNPDGSYNIYLDGAHIATLKYALTGDFDQIDPGDTVYIDFKLHFEEDLPQDSDFSFTIQLVYYNWNEA